MRLAGSPSLADASCLKILTSSYGAQGVRQAAQGEARTESSWNKYTPAMPPTAAAPITTALSEDSCTHEKLALFISMERVKGTHGGDDAGHARPWVQEGAT